MLSNHGLLKWTSRFKVHLKYIQEEMGEYIIYKIDKVISFIIIKI